jgi:hypothetical protein
MKNKNELSVRWRCSVTGTEYVLANTAMMANTAPAQETGASSSPKHAVTHSAATSCPHTYDAQLLSVTQPTGARAI